MGMYSLATGLSTFNNRSAIKVRVIHSYLVREKKGSADLKSQELVLHDPENNQPLKQITELAGKTLLFQITAKSDHTAYRNTPFPVLRINNDPHILKEHCSQLLKLEDNACNSNMQISLGDDDFLEVSSKLEDWRKNTMDILKIASKELGFYTLESFIKDIID
nr:putative transposase [Ipomoea batatas]